MKRLMVTLFLFLAPLAFGSTDPATQQLLVNAARRASLFYEQTTPIQVDVDFVAQINVPVPGHLTLKWQSEDHWWRKIVMGDFQQLEVRNGDRFYTLRNTNSAPIRIAELSVLLNFAEASDDFIPQKRKEKKTNGVPELCVLLERENSSLKEEICLNPANREILSKERQGAAGEKRTKHYSDYADFGAHHYPRKLEYSVNGSSLVSATIANVQTIAFDETLLAPPKGAIERRICAGMKHAVAITTPDLQFRAFASHNKIRGDTTVSLTVLTDGSVTDLQIVDSAGRVVDEPSLNSVKARRFMPAMCGAEPVVSDLQMVLSFRK